jgi:hypothetical protein
MCDNLLVHIYWDMLLEFVASYMSTPFLQNTLQFEHSGKATKYM